MRGATSHAPLADFSRACPPEARRFVERVRAIPDVAAVAVYPDVHLGGDPTGEPSCVGTAIATRSRLVPAWLGSDLGCGVAAVRLARSSEPLRDATRRRRALAAIARAIPIQRHARPLAHDLDPLDGEIVERALRMAPEYRHGDAGNVDVGHLAAPEPDSALIRRTCARISAG